MTERAPTVEAILAAWDEWLAGTAPAMSEMGPDRLAAHAVALELNIALLDAHIASCTAIAQERADRALTLWRRLSAQPVTQTFDVDGLTADDVVTAASLLNITPSDPDSPESRTKE